MLFSFLLILNPLKLHTCIPKQCGAVHARKTRIHLNLISIQRDWETVNYPSCARSSVCVLFVFRSPFYFHLLIVLELLVRRWHIYMRDVYYIAGVRARVHFFIHGTNNEIYIYIFLFSFVGVVHFTRFCSLYHVELVAIGSVLCCFAIAPLVVIIQHIVFCCSSKTHAHSHAQENYYGLFRFVSCANAQTQTHLILIEIFFVVASTKEKKQQHRQQHFDKMCGWRCACDT